MTPCRSRLRPVRGRADVQAGVGGQHRPLLCREGILCHHLPGAGPEPAQPEVRIQRRIDFFGAFWQPIASFFSTNGVVLAVVLLAFVGLFKFPDQVIGVMAGPFYLDSGFTKADIATVSKLFGVWVGIAGAFIGGAAVVRFGAHRMLLVAMLLGALSNLLYVVLSYFPGNIQVFVAVIGGENLSGGFLGAVAVAWLSALVSREYTATQYALFSSLVTLPGKLIGGFSGFMVAGMGYEGFFIFSTLAVVPALLLFAWLTPRLNTPAN